MWSSRQNILREHGVLIDLVNGSLNNRLARTEPRGSVCLVSDYKFARISAAEQSWMTNTFLSIFAYYAINQNT